MVQGIYSITFRGMADWGMGILIFQNGAITGADVGGVVYDGTYRDAGEKLVTNIIMTVPPGGSLVQGTPPRPSAYEIKFDVTIDKQSLLNGQPVLMHLPPGPVNVIFHQLRSLN